MRPANSLNGNPGEHRTTAKNDELALAYLAIK